VSNEWQSIETAPKDGNILTAWWAPAEHEWIIRTALVFAGRFHAHGGSPYTVHYEPTHWMPLPAPPEPR
jgi:hypothetical protein